MLDRNGIPPSWKLLQQLQEIGFFLGGVGWVKGGREACGCGGVTCESAQGNRLS